MSPHLSPTQTICTLAVVLLVCSYAALALRRVYFHSLSHFPGPKLAAATFLYRAWYQIVRDGGHLRHWNKLHEEYGPIVRISPNQLHFSNPVAFEQIYCSRSGFSKDDDFYAYTGQTEALFGMSDEKLHKERFKRVASLFTTEAIIEFEAYIQANARRFCQLLDEVTQQKNPVANLALGFRALALDVVLDFVYDVVSPSFRGLQDHSFASKYNVATYAMFDFTNWLGRNFPIVFTVTPWIPLRISRFLLPGDSAFAEFDIITREITRQRIQVSKPIRDCYLARFPKDWDLDLLTAECSGTILGGVIDLTNVLQYGTFQLCGDQMLQERLHTEILSVWPLNAQDRPPTKVLESLELLTGLIKESLRFTHGVITGPPRVVSSTGAIVDGAKVPASTVVTSSSYYSHMDPNVFSKPEKFSPERWFRATPEMERALSAFGKGKRACPGRKMAMTELYLIFATVFRRFRFEAHNTNIEDFELKAYLSPHFAGRPFHAKLSKRNIALTK